MTNSAIGQTLTMCLAMSVPWVPGSTQKSLNLPLGDRQNDLPSTTLMPLAPSWIPLSMMAILTLASGEKYLEMDWTSFENDFACSIHSHFLVSLSELGSLTTRQAGHGPLTSRSQGCCRLREAGHPRFSSSV